MFMMNLGILRLKRLMEIRLSIRMIRGGIKHKLYILMEVKLRGTIINLIK